MIRNTTKKQKLGWVLFIVYMAAVVYFMFFAESFDRPDVRQEYHYNLILFKEIKRFIIYRDQLGIYAYALAQTLGLPVRECLLYSFALSRTVPVPPAAFEGNGLDAGV